MTNPTRINAPVRNWPRRIHFPTGAPSPGRRWLPRSCWTMIHTTSGQRTPAMDLHPGMAQDHSEFPFDQSDLLPQRLLNGNEIHKVLVLIQIVAAQFKFEAVGMRMQPVFGTPVSPA